LIALGAARRLWLSAIDMGNLSSHTYKEDLPGTAYAFVCSFVPQLQALAGL
jgi:hypothetical protein